MILQEVLQEKCFFLAFLQDLVEHYRNLVTRFLLDSCKTQMSQDLAQVQEKRPFLGRCCNSCNISVRPLLLVKVRTLGLVLYITPLNFNDFSEYSLQITKFMLQKNCFRMFFNHHAYKCDQI